MAKLSSYLRGLTTTTGISTFSNVVVNSNTSTGTANQNLQVTGGTYISGNTGIGSESPQSKLDVSGDLRLGGTTNSVTINPDHEYPSIRPTLDLNFAATKTLDRRITFTRDSVGTYTDELGIIRTAPNNTPRFDHDPTTGESLGLLIEESRTNLITYSQDFTQSVWQNANNRATCNNTTGIDDPSGGTTASRWSSGTSNSQELIYRQTGTSAGALTGQTCTKSTWIRRVSNDGNVAFFIGDNVSNSVTSQLDSVPVGTWIRCSITYTIVGNNGDTRNYIAVYPGTDGQPTTIDIWGDQFEIGSFATSYIPTSDATVTRAVDIAKITGTNFTDFYNDTEGTLFIHADKSETTNDMGVTINNMSSVSNNRIELRLTGSNTSTTRHVINSGGTGYMDSTTNIIDVNRYSFAFARNNAIPCTNGTLGTLDTIVEMPVGVDQMTIGSTPALSGDSTTRIRQVSYYNKRLPNAQLQGLTAQ